MIDLVTPKGLKTLSRFLLKEPGAEAANSTPPSD